ncbi:hypothetical protein RclHR1_01430011 [Rhizophagus clarus]|uniref:Uncharacterized protein n=1 Tax=Rhizophagus clarus TaxID=94130 RepID=A0A2Z6QGL7_9GLOM|nr:hypothetical protein RclHR1_01430011 [Rhizophagus clarus]GES99849.1 hypothetical protein GLOIN_2v1879464 [Rhizophagus clarus]
MIKPQILAYNSKKILKILTIINNIVKVDGESTSLIKYPVLIGSRAAKWHVSSFREPNDWDLVATPSQSTLFINKVRMSGASCFENIKLIHYPGGGLKLVGGCINLFTSEKSNFDIELVSDKVDLRNVKSNVTLNKEESDKDNYEFERFNDARPKISSALMILDLCRNIKDKVMFPLLSNFPCIVAPLKILEALKTSHVHWPTNFHKNIADLHFLRILSGYNNVSMNQPLCSPQRDESIELMIKTRIKETEIIRGKPGAHINLNMTNEEFLDHEDNLFVRKRVPHDDLHELVKYGDYPIYKSLKDDQSKAWTKKSLFENLDYQTKLNCVKEEAMVIALERYLIPRISENQETSYNMALARICTTLTRGWFRQFAIDNYPRLSNLDKDLLPIAHDIIDKFPIKRKKSDVLVPDPETRAIFEFIRPYTETISSFDRFHNIKRHFSANRTGIKITSPVNNDISVTAIVTTTCFPRYNCGTNAVWSASVVILPSKDLEILNDKKGNNSDEKLDPSNLHPRYYNRFSELTSKHIFVLGVKADAGNDSWGPDDPVGEFWNPMRIEAKSADYVANMLQIPDLTGDLLFKYVLSCLQPTIQDNGETPLKHWVNELKSKGEIPIEPKQHLWYYAWNYILNDGKFIS